MTQAQRFHQFISSLLSIEKLDTKDTTIVYVCEKTLVAMLKSRINDKNKDMFINYIQQIPRANEGLSYKDLANCAPYYLSENQAKIIQGVGVGLGVWKLIPESFPIAEDLKQKGLLPMNMGF